MEVVYRPEREGANRAGESLAILDGAPSGWHPWGIVGSIQASCSGCGRAFSFDPASARRTCQICGGEITLPEGFEPPKPPPGEPTVTVVACPICERSKELEGFTEGQTVTCWFCQAPLAFPAASGLARLALPGEKPVPPEVPPLPPEGIRDAMTTLIWEILQKSFTASALGAATAEWIPEQLTRIRAWERAGGSDRSPLAAPLTAQILAFGVFQAHDAVIDTPGPGRAHITFGISNEGDNIAGGVLASGALGVAAFAVTGIGWVPNPDNDAGEQVVTYHLDIELEELHGETRIGYSIRSSEGGFKNAGSFLGPNYASDFPAAFAAAARGMLAFKAAFGAAVPGRLVGYVTRESLHVRLLDCGFDESAASRAVSLFFRTCRNTSGPARG